MKNSVLDLSVIRFPVVTFGNDRLMYFGRERDDVAVCTKTALENGFYKGLRVIDADGIEHRIQDVGKVGTVGPLWGYNIFLDQKLRVELYLGKKGDVVSLDSLKMQISKILSRDRAFWDSDGLIKENLDSISKAASHFEVIKKLLMTFI